ncbi:hypothetical protein HJC23_011910 [Cyclotella cryptica]|uniref:Uncharacterized protein n=1 Tax=Cyclotella cryptica TaxID=29204 RepID=A0ABD3PJR6_9STRA|eukprot:CCRYP_013862-RA/>CCRYP_013862-RA protein AED:0.43 eAED:0.43 QI:0/-1/0/1/-1/1/1/0/102
MVTGKIEKEGLAVRPEQAGKPAKINQLVRINATNKTEEGGRVVNQERVESQQEISLLVLGMAFSWIFRTLNIGEVDDHPADRNTMKERKCAALIVLPKPMAL